MSFKLPDAPAKYSQHEENQFRGQLVAFLNRCFTSKGDLRLKTVRLTITDEDGVEWAFTVATSGALDTEPYS